MGKASEISLDFTFDQISTLKRHNPLNWIHIDDQVGLIEHSIVNDHVSGVLNAVSPQMANHRELAMLLKGRRSLGGTSDRRGVVKYGSESWMHLTGGSWVEPQRTLERKVF